MMKATGKESPTERMTANPVPSSSRQQPPNQPVAIISGKTANNQPNIGVEDDNNNNNNSSTSKRLDAANYGPTTNSDDTSTSKFNHHHQQQQQQPSTSTTRTTPQSQSSSISTPTSSSSGKMGGSNHSSNNSQTTTTSIGKFKEKRPEPLKLDPALNQDIPLNLSTKSTGTIPFPSLFNLPNATLETPRIVWQDNESLLIKHRHFSSTSSASQRIPLFSLAGDSPPITPNTPFNPENMICSPTISSSISSSLPLNHQFQRHQHILRNRLHQLSQKQSSSYYQNQPKSAGFLHPPSIQTLMQLDYNRRLENFFFRGQAGGGTTLTGQNGETRNDWSYLSGLRKKSCSTEELSMLDGRSKEVQLMKDRLRDVLNDNRNRVATSRNDTSQINSNDMSSHLNQQTTHQEPPTNTCSSTDSANERQTSVSPIVNVTANDNSQPSFESTLTNPTQTIRNSILASNIDNQKEITNLNAPTPTGIAKATANLLNINLNSPTSSLSLFENHHQESYASSINGLIDKRKLLETISSSSSHSGLTTSHHQITSNAILNQKDPLLSAVYAQQQQQHNNNNNELSTTHQKAPSSFYGSRTPSSGSTFYYPHQHRLQDPITTTSTSSSMTLMNYQQSGLNNSRSGGLFSSSTTLNTPTLISPSQLKTGSQCFLPSPTLSPMSVFEIPLQSPLFPMATNNEQLQLRSGQMNTNGKLNMNTNANLRNTSEPALTSPIEKMKLDRQQQFLPINNLTLNPVKASSDNALLGSIKGSSINNTSEQHEASTSENNLIHLVTSAKDKVGAQAFDEEENIVGEEEDEEEEDEDVLMEAEEQNSVEPNKKNEEKIAAQIELEQTKTSSIPRILVTNCLQRQQQQQQQALSSGQQSHWNCNNNNNNNNIKMTNSCSQEAPSLQRLQTNQIAKRAVSHQSFKSRIDLHYNARHESSSAPPDVYEGLPRSKVKSAITSSASQDWPEAIKISQEVQMNEMQSQPQLQLQPQPQQKHQPQQQQIHQQHQQQHPTRGSSAPYPTELTNVNRRCWSQQQQQQSTTCPSITTGYAGNRAEKSFHPLSSTSVLSNSTCAPPTRIYGSSAIQANRSNSAEPASTNQQLSWEQLNEFKRQQQHHHQQSTHFTSVNPNGGSCINPITSDSLSSAQQRQPMGQASFAPSSTSAAATMSNSCSNTTSQHHKFAQSAQQLSNCSSNRPSLRAAGSGFSTASGTEAVNCSIGCSFPSTNAKPQQQASSTLSRSSQLSSSEIAQHQQQNRLYQQPHPQANILQHQKQKYALSSSVADSLNTIRTFSNNCIQPFAFTDSNNNLYHQTQIQRDTHHPQQMELYQQQQQHHAHYEQLQQQQLRRPPLVTQRTNHSSTTNHLPFNPAARKQQEQLDNRAMNHQSVVNRSTIPTERGGAAALIGSSSSTCLNQVPLAAAAAAGTATALSCASGNLSSLHQSQQRLERINHRALSTELVSGGLGSVSGVNYEITRRSDTILRSESSCDFGKMTLGGGNSFRSSSACDAGGASNLSSSSNSPCGAVKKYRCNQCSKAFTRSDMLTRHKRLHSGDRPFQCNECKQEFSRSDHLSTHMRTHTGEKPYKCKLCSYSACRKDMITRHMKVHNRSSPNAFPIELAR